MNRRFLALAITHFCSTFCISAHFLRLMITIMTKSCYRVRVVGKENVPRKGPALIVLNHTTFIDGPLIVSIFKRLVRFVVYKGHYDSSILRWMGLKMQQLTIDPEGPPRELIGSLRKASEALRAGELVAVFAEGSLTRTGFLQPFYRGMEVIMKRAKGVPIIPTYVDGMWGSIFSFHRGVFFKKWPKAWRYPVTIKFGEPMPSDSTVEQIRHRILELGADCWDLRKQNHRPIHRQFLRVAHRHSRRPCVVDLDTPGLNFGSALMRSVILRQLLSRRIGPDRYVGLLVPPTVAGALANIAVSFLGKVPVNLNYTVGGDVLDRCIAKCGIKQVITSRKFIQKVGLQPDAELIYLEDLRKDLRAVDKLRGVAVRLLPAWFGERWLLGIAKHTMDDLATIIFSSGSTGDPKGVMLTHHNIYSNVESVAQMVDATEQDLVMGVLPYFHSFGYTVTLWLPLLTGCAGIYHYNPLEAEVVGKLIRRHKATVFVSTATFLRHYIRKCEKDDFRSLRLLVCGAEKLPMAVAEEFERKFGVTPMEGYGCTELSPAVSANRPDVVEAPGGPQIGHKPGTIGHTMPGQVAKIVDPQTREPLPMGEEGLLMVRGPNVMKGYLNDPELTAEVVTEEGWYVTGDIAKLDSDGFITITDRLSRFSKIGGEMVPHSRVEDQIHKILDTHERVCVVVGLPDERKGERLVVLHTPLPMEVNQLWSKLKESGLPPLWLPAPAAFYEVDQLPVLGSGKLDLGSIKRMAQEKVQAA